MTVLRIFFVMDWCGWAISGLYYFLYYGSVRVSIFIIALFSLLWI